MLRRLNRTDRRRIEAGMVTIRLHPDARPQAFTATLRLDELQLPADGAVVIEAYRMSAVERFDLGAVGTRHAPSRIELAELAADETLSFRVKVVETETGRLLALNRRIRPGEGAGGRVSLMKLRDADLGEEPWRVVVDGDDVVLEINERVPKGVEALTSVGAVQSLVLPAAFRQVLLRLWIEEAQPVEDGGDDEDWRGRWMGFARDLAGEGPGDWSDGAAWIDAACAAFARRSSLMGGLAATEEA